MWTPRKALLALLALWIEKRGGNSECNILIQFISWPISRKLTEFTFSCDLPRHPETKIVHFWLHTNVGASHKVCSYLIFALKVIHYASVTHLQPFWLDTELPPSLLRNVPT